MAVKNYQTKCSFGSYNNLCTYTMNDICESLIQHEGEKVDLQWQQQYSFLSMRSIPTNFQDPVPALTKQLSGQMDSEFSQEPAKPTDQNNLKSSVNDDNGQKRQFYGKTKLIKKIISHDSESNQESYSHTNTTIRRRKARIGNDSKNKPYPTKNFLPNFKGPHLQFIRKYLRMSLKDFNSIKFIDYLNNKDGISLEDYQALYNMEEFAQALDAMFRCKYLYRELLLSRSMIGTKKNHMRKLHVFEKAFRTKVFAKIN